MSIKMHVIYLPVNHRVPHPHFDEVFVNGCLRSFKYPSNFGIA